MHRHVNVAVLGPACDEFSELQEKYEQERTIRELAEDFASKVSTFFDFALIADQMNKLSMHIYIVLCLQHRFKSRFKLINVKLYLL